MATHLKIVIVEDHLELRKIIATFLSEDGHYIFQAADAEDLDQILIKEAIDIVVLDLNLPGEDGISIAKRLKKSSPKLFIIMLTARQKPEDRVKGYDSGADLYITKPSSASELSAAINSFSRRLSAELYTQSNIQLISRRCELSGNGRVTINAVEMSLLKALCQAPEQRLEYYKLLELFDTKLDTKAKSALEVHITRLRKKLVDVGAQPPAIRAIRNEGYQLVESITIF
jgi:DNA-binding response OmpR family regulator